MAEIRRVRHGGDPTLLVLESMVVLGVAVVVCCAQNHQIYHWLTTALPAHHRRLYVVSPGETEGNAIRITLFSGMLLAVPLLAVLGIVVGGAVIAPFSARQLVTAEGVVDYLPRARDYIDFAMGLLPASGIGGASLGALALRRAA